MKCSLKLFSIIMGLYCISLSATAQIHTFQNNSACTLYVELTYYFDDGSGGACHVVCADFIKTEAALVAPGNSFVTNNGPFFGNTAGNWGMLQVTDPNGDAEQAGPCAVSSGPITCSGSTITLNWIDCYNSDAF